MSSRMIQEFQIYQKGDRIIKISEIAYQQVFAFLYLSSTIGSITAKNILVTGGAGFIGSHTVLQLLLGGYNAVVVDNLNNSSDITIRRVKELAGEYGNNLYFHKLDLRDKPALQKLFAERKIDAVLHVAGLKAVGESMKKPLLYYNNNLIGAITLLEVMAAHRCKNLVFSSFVMSRLEN